jgi:Fungal specific transcription factor domain
VPNLNIRDLELLHHYTTATCLTLGQNTTVQTLWRVTVPQIGFSHPFVLRAMLAISAFHLAYLRQEQKAHYLAQATYHHEVALQNVTPILETLIAENPTAAFTFSSLTCFIACAKPRIPGDFFLVESGELSRWLVIFRATKTIIERAKGALMTGPLAPMFRIGLKKYFIFQAKPTDKPNFLQALESLIMEEASDPTELNIYLEAVDVLAKAFAVVSDASIESSNTSDIFMWMSIVSIDYLSLLRRLRPVALVIFAHYCVMVRCLEWLWWLQGWSRDVISAIYSLLAETHRPWLQWPMEQIGWAP